MRKSLLMALIGATLLTPVAATAQDRPDRGPRGDRGGRAERSQQQPQPRADREQYRAQREQLRAARQTGFSPDQRRAWQQRADTRQDVRTERRDDRRDFNRERRDDRRDVRAGVVTRQQFRSDRADDRRDFRQDRRDDRQQYRAGGYRAVDRNAGRSWNDRRGWDDRRDWNDNRGWNNNRGWDNRRNWNRGWRAENRYDWRAYRYRNRAAFHLPRYYAPSGWGYGYRRFNVGVTLSSGLWGQNYWIDDPFSYRLPDAWGPYRWVRYFNDALLVDIRSGQVVDVEYDIFW